MRPRTAEETWMSDEVICRITYAVPYGIDNIRQVLGAYETVLCGNWRLADRRSPELPDIGGKMRQSLSSCDEERLTEIDQGDEIVHMSDPTIGFPFSPLSCRVAGLSFIKRQEGILQVYFDVPDVSLTSETEGDRQRMLLTDEARTVKRNQGKDPFAYAGLREGDPGHREWNARWYALDHLEQSVWPQNRQCFLAIVEKLKGVFPVKEIELDEMPPTEEE